MGWLGVVLGIVTAFLLWGTGHPVLLSLAILAAAGCFWSWGIMHNFATEMAKQRPSYKGGFYDITEAEANSVPNWITNLNILFTLVSVVLLIVAVAIRML